MPRNPEPVNQEGDPMASTSKGGKAPIQKQGQTSGNFGNNPGVKEVNPTPTPLKP